MEYKRKAMKYISSESKSVLLRTVCWIVSAKPQKELKYVPLNGVAVDPRVIYFAI